MRSDDDFPRRNRGGDSGTDPNAWMSTFSDLLMLMLTFFVLLLSMSSLDQQKVRSLTRDGLQTERPSRVEKVVGPTQIVERPAITSRVADLQRALNAPFEKIRSERVEQLFEKMHEATGLEGPLWVEKRPGGLLINMDSTVVFEEDTDELTAEARAFLKQFAQVVGAGSYSVVAEAFVKSDDDSADWSQTWDLALRRADNTVNYLIDQQIRESRLSIAGYGYAAGTETKRFVRHSKLLRFHLVAGPPGAEPDDVPNTSPMNIGAE